MVDALIRPAGPGDERTLAQLQRDLWQQAWAGLLPAAVLATPIDDLAGRWADRLGDRGRVLLATEGAHPVGFAAVGKADPDDATVDDDGMPRAVGQIEVLGVLPRFARRGHGGRILVAAAAALRSFGLESAVWWVPEQDTSIERFLTGAGWHGDARRRVLDTGDGTLTERRWSGGLDLIAV